MKFLNVLVLPLLIVGWCSAASAETPLLPPSADGTEDSSEIQSVEQELQPLAELAQEEREIEAREQEQNQRPQAKSISDLNQLSPFSQVSVIQRKFLPKTERLQIYGGLINTLNNPWYNMLGLDVRLGYHFTESWALEGHLTSQLKSETQSIKEIRSEHDVVTSNLITPQGFMGANLTWYPIYGKMSLLNKRIIPFDMYFYLGGGTMSFEGGNQSSSTAIQGGAGQVFALSKSLGFRWDFNWSNFSATPKQDGTSSKPGASNFNHINLTVGLSYFFPEAKYR